MRTRSGEIVNNFSEMGVDVLDDKMSRVSDATLRPGKRCTSW
jgi:hypothetical protein